MDRAITNLPDSVDLLDSVVLCTDATGQQPPYARPPSSSSPNRAQPGLENILLRMLA